jgi:hypothetical protein
MYAHIYRAAGKKVRLILSTGPSISEGIVSEALFDSKADAKKAAKAAGAKAWNF